MLRCFKQQAKVAALGIDIPIQHSGPAVQNNIHADVIEGALNRRLFTQRSCRHFTPANLLYKYYTCEKAFTQGSSMRIY